MQQGNYPLLEIKDIKFFAVWQYLQSDLNKTCPICKKNLTESCNDCESELSDDNVCRIAQGQCGHCFHKHCIEKWIQNGALAGKQPKCGFCGQHWDVNEQCIINS